MIKKYILIVVFIILSVSKSFCQEKNRIYFSGIRDSVIKKSQLLDTTIKIITNIDIAEKGTGVQIYFSGEGFSNVQVMTVGLGARLSFIKNRLIIGSNITIEGISIINPKTGKRIYFEESSYKIIAD